MASRKTAAAITPPPGHDDEWVTVEGDDEWVTVDASAPETTRSTYVQDHGPAYRFGAGAVEALNPAPLVRAAFSPIETFKAMHAHQTEKMGQGREQLSKGEYAKGALSIAESLPIVGGLVEGVAEKLGQGDVAGALGTGAGLAAMPKVYGTGAKLAVKGGTKTAQTAAKVASRTAEGYREGGVGGAAVRLVKDAPQVVSTRTMMQAIRPQQARVGFEKSLDRSLPELKVTEQITGKPIENLDGLLEAIKLSKERVWQDLQQVMDPSRSIGKVVDLTPVANAIRGSITKTMRLEDPAAVKAIEQIADRYKGNWSLPEAEQFLYDTTAQEAAFYSKLPAVRDRAIRTGGDLAQVTAKADALRTAIFKALDDVVGGAGASAKELRQRYGSLMELNEQAQRRINVYRRAQEDSLAEQVAATSAAGDVARGVVTAATGHPIRALADVAEGYVKRSASKFIKEQQTTDSQIKRALKHYNRMPTPVMIPPPVTPVTNPARLLGPGPMRMPAPPGGLTMNVTTSPPLQPKIKGLLPRGAYQMPGVDTTKMTVTSGEWQTVRDPYTGKVIQLIPPPPR